MPQPNIPGEEWRSMDEVARAYRPDEALLARSRQSIQRLRMRDVDLRVLRRDGAPLAHAPLDIVQTRSSFCFGEQLWSLQELYRFNEHQTDRARYYTLRFTEALNACNALCYWTERPRNDGPKMEDLQGDPQIDNFAWAVDWGNANGLTVKGHPLFWSIQKCVPEWVKRYDYDTQMKFAEVRVRNLVARFRGKVKLWDAVNEPMWEPAFRNLPQRHWPHLDPIKDIADYIQPVLRWCRDEDPDATFLVNDYGMEKDKGEGDVPVARDGTRAIAALQRKRFLALLRELADRGTPPGAVGLQSHTGGWLDHATQVAVYDEMATSGLPIHITEFWANTHHLKESNLPPQVIDQMAADYVCNYLTCAFGHPAIEAFFFWGFMNASVEWGKRSSHEPRLMYDRVRDLLKNQWMTRLSVTTDADGRARFRGFLGDYALRYALDDKSRAGSTFTVSSQDAMPLTLVAPLAR
jgi:GH35 family endo-1,4-beta-xylanase